MEAKPEALKVVTGSAALLALALAAPARNGGGVSGVAAGRRMTFISTVGTLALLKQLHPRR